MKKLFAASVTCIVLTVALLSCGKENEDLKAGLINEYYPLQAGKAFIYRLDSTILAPFGTALIVHSYQAKDSVESTFTDNQGRLSYRIYRFTRDTAARQPWKFAATYVATPTPATIEYVDNNMRFVKLTAPIIEGRFFKAHNFIDTKSANSGVRYLDEWEYEYRNVGANIMLANKTYDETVTVAQRDELNPPGPFNPNNFQERNYGQEIYARGIGMIYKEFMHWTYQTTPPPSKYEDGSYGIKLTLLNHY